MSARGVLGVATLGAAAGWTAALRADRRRVAADPAGVQLAAPLDGRPQAVRSADGTALHAEVFGPDDAPTIVLIHGWIEGVRLWTYQIRALSREHRIVAYELRGHGRSARPAPGGGYRMEDHAADLEAVLRACVPEGERAVVAGHSLGAMTIVAWAREHAAEVADRLAGAALICTGLGDIISEALVVRTPAGWARVRQTVGVGVLTAKLPFPRGVTPISSRVIRAVALGPDASPATIAFCQDLFYEARPDVRAACGATMSRMDLHEAVARLDVPTVVVAGERDLITPPVHAKRIAATLPQLAAYVEVPGAGHMAVLEVPDAVTSAIAAVAVRPAETLRTS